MGALQGQNILLLEDSEILYNPLNQLLENMGANVKRAFENDNFFTESTYSVGIFRCESGKTALVQKLIDLKKKRPDFRIILTIEPSEKTMLPGELLSKTDFILEKPFTSKKLKMAVEKALYLPLSGKEILIVEEVSVSRKAFENICKALGATVYSFSTIPLTKEIPLNISIAITDIPLRDIQSVNFLTALRERSPTSQVFLISNVNGAATLADVSVLNEVSYILSKPVNDNLLRKKIIDVIEQPYSDRRRSARKQGISNCWVSSWNQELNRPELFESPFLMDISQQGMSFQSRNDYVKEEKVIIWISDESTQQGGIIELRGSIRWVSQTESVNASSPVKKYGVQFHPADSPGMDKFIRMITSLIS